MAAEDAQVEFEDFEEEALSFAAMILVDVMGRHELDELVLEIGSGMPDMLCRALTDEEMEHVHGS
jgi:hypothetical protein